VTPDDVDDLEDDDNDSLLAAVARIPVQTAAVEWKPPPELDEYKLIEPLGKGGMGSVWLAHDRLLDRLVALKFIAHSEPDSQTRDRFAVEARAAARLQHPNVVTVYRYGEVAGRPYLVAEYIRGEPLDKLAKPVGWERVLELGIALARGLAAAHRHGIVHRDIKPANAILSIDGEAKLVDFGLARLEPAKRGSRPSMRDELAVGSTDALTSPGTVAGTPRYLSPEVRRGEVADRRSDVYGIGCVLYELLIGRAPVMDLADGSTVDSGSAPDQPRDAARAITGRIDPAGAKLAAIVDRCLAPDPADRYASGDELREALEQLAAPVAERVELPEGNPYRGLVPYDAEHRALFFGRGAETRAVIERLRADPFVLVTGDSGAGKSSLCRAGVLPAIALDDRVAWSVVQLVPHHRPLTTLASLLAPHLGLDEAAVATLLRDEPSRLPRELRRALGDGKGMVVFVDQLEELSTISDRDEVAAFSRALAELATGGPGVRLLATVRSDFLTRVAELPGLGAEIARAIYLLQPLSAEGAREAIVGPARAKGVTLSPALVDTLVASVADTSRIELPLLAFTLAQLWDARDPDARTISAKALDAIGGVRGALARHADGVLDSLLPEQRTAAKKLLLRLVTPEKTRARRSAAELTGLEPALDALVRARLVVARGDDPPAFELAHERLIDGWPTLAHWVSDTAEAIAARARLGAAVAAWERLGRAKDALWAQRQLTDLELLASEDLTAAEAAFARASRRAVGRRRWMRRGVAIAIPLVVLGVYVGAKVVAQRDVARRVADTVSDAGRHLVRARAANEDSAKFAREAFAAFDAGAKPQGEATWQQARQRSTEAQEAYGAAARTLEAGFLLDTDRDDVRRQLAEVTLERLELAEREHRTAERAELEARLGLYDQAGDFAARRTRPARVDLAVTPATAQVSISPMTIVNRAVATSQMPFASGAAIAPGLYLVVAQAPGHATVQLPILVRSGEPQRIEFALPPTSAVPPGFVYIPAGPLLSGSRDDEFMRTFQDAPPMHARMTGAFLIAIHEVTYGDWIAFLDGISEDERAKHTPQIENSATVQTGGELALEKSARGWALHITPAGVSYTAVDGAPLAYKERATNAQQAWRKLPVSGITAVDVQAYADWLDKTGKVKRARLCTELEWERAARGPDGRPFPNGEKLLPEEANFDETYQRKEGGFGPDEVGSHPASASPFGIHDASGNVWEILKAPNGIAMRGGGYYTGSITAHLANRQEIPPAFKHLHAGTRMCADPP
jgi:serine/threonine protein kinase/formylglycine-generating enzyme required for sulfatase activity